MMVVGAGIESLALRFMKASPIWLAEGNLGGSVEEAVLHIFRPEVEGRRAHANTKRQ